MVADAMVVKFIISKYSSWQKKSLNWKCYSENEIIT